MKVEEIDDMELLESLGSTICPACGNEKNRKQTLCYKDYSRLTKEEKQNLYNLVRGGYKEAVVAAFVHLKKTEFIMPA